jgi:outer membrane protein
LKKLTLAIALSSSLTIQATELSELIEQAKQVSIEQATTQKDLLLSEMAITEAYQVLYPTLNTAASIGYNKLADQDGSDTYSLSLGIEQNIYNLSAFKQLDIFKLSHQLNQISLQGVDQSLIYAVTEALINKLKAIDALELAETERATIEKQLDQTLQRYEVGLVSVTAVKDAEASMASTEAALIQRQIQLQNASLQLNTLLQDNVQNDVQFEIADYVTNFRLQPLELLLEQALEKHPQILSAQTASALQSKQLELMKSQHVPFLAAAVNGSIATDQMQVGSEDEWSTSTSIGLQVSQFQNDYRPAINASLGYAWNDIDADDEVEGALSASLGFSYSLNWYNIGKEPQAWREQQIKMSQSQDQLRGAERQILQNIELSHSLLKANLQGLNAQQKLLDANLAALETTQVGYDVGARNIVELLNAQRAVYAAETSLKNAQYDVLLANLRLLQAAGLLDSLLVTQLDEYM